MIKCTLRKFLINLTIPQSGVLTPLAAFTAVLPKDPETGIDWKKDPKRLEVPRANISWVASTLPDFAKKKQLIIALFYTSFFPCLPPGFLPAVGPTERRW